MLKSRSALESFRGQGVTRANGQPTVRLGERVNGQPAVRLGEIATTDLLHIGVYPGTGTAARVAAGAAAILGGALPDSPFRAATTANHLILRIAPDQYWVLGGRDQPTLEAQLRAAIPANAGCVTSLQGARTHLFVEGPGARALLGRLVPIDLHPTVFPVGGFAQTGIHHVAALLLRAAADRYEIFALRTFAACTWEVLVDAARPLSYEIAFPEAP